MKNTLKKCWKAVLAALVVAAKGSIRKRLRLLAFAALVLAGTLAPTGCRTVPQLSDEQREQLHIIIADNVHKLREKMDAWAEEEAKKALEDAVSGGSGLGGDAFAAPVGNLPSFGFQYGNFRPSAAVEVWRGKMTATKTHIRLDYTGAPDWFVNAPGGRMFEVGVQYDDGGTLVGCKFDWIDKARTSRELKHIYTQDPTQPAGVGYRGWPWK